MNERLHTGPNSTWKKPIILIGIPFLVERISLVLHEMEKEDVGP